jgi:hypothetical protein
MQYVKNELYLNIYWTPTFVKFVMHGFDIISVEIESLRLYIFTLLYISFKVIEYLSNNTFHTKFKNQFIFFTSCLEN